MKIINVLLFLLIAGSLFAQNTGWTEDKLKDHWKTNGADVIEGIYENVAETSFSPKYSNALIKTPEGYSLIYLSGAVKDDAKRWKTGDVKAYLIPTATQYVFKTTWYYGNKEPTEDLYITFENGFMNVIWTNGYPQNLYIKLFPTPKDSITQTGSSAKLASGTGFGITRDGIIVTNFHVIDGAKTIKIRGVNSDFSKVYNAKLLFSDKNNDLALIQIDDEKFTLFDTIPYTIKTGLAGVGENIFVLGYPLRATMGDEVKLTNGIISSKTGFQGDISLYQISAPVQPGNSGGPLFDSEGNVIGIVNAKHTGAENAAYAVKTGCLANLIDLLPGQSKLQTENSLKGKTLPQQVELAKKFVYIIETE